MTSQVYHLGADISKATIDCHLLPADTTSGRTRTGAGASFRVANSPAGYAALETRLRAKIDTGARVLVTAETTGDCERGLHHALTHAGIPVAIVNPKRSRDFGKALGQLAKTDRLNRGKQSLVADIKDPADMALLQRIAARADVYIQNLAPGAAARAGPGSDALRARHPRLITCDISGYGEDGPYRDMKAYDLLIQAESGLCSVTGTADQPARVGVSAGDIATGMYAHQAILQALYARQRTGCGRGIKVSLFDSMADWMSVPYLQHRYGGRTPRRTGLHHPSIAPYGAYACAGGAQILLSIQNEREWRRLCDEVLGDAALTDDPRFHDNPARVAHRPALDAVLAARFAGLDREAAAARLFAAGIACGRLSTLDDVVAHPQLRRVTVPTAAGPVELPAPPPILDDASFDPGTVPPGTVPPGTVPPGTVPPGTVPPGTVPEVGAHDAAIRAEFAAAAAAAANIQETGR